MDKQTMLAQKIKNFIILMEKEIPNEKTIINEYNVYLTNMNKFLQDIIALSKYEINDENIKKYLAYKNVKTEIKKELMNKIQQYIKMFIDVINN